MQKEKIMKGTDDILQVLGFQDQETFLQVLQNYYDSKGYPWNDHILGIRMDDNYTDGFTDWLCVLTQDGIFAYQGSTKPGSEKAGKGAAVLVSGYYHDLWGKGTTEWSGLPY